MDLSLSPDIDARLNYLIVFVVGLAVARNRVTGLLSELRGAWLLVETWILLGVYSAIPLVLFWLLDRSGALSDTSLFAAILVSIASRQILAGGVTGIAAPAPLAGAWQPLVAWTDRLAERIRARVQRRLARYQDRLCSQIAADAARTARLADLVKSHSAAPADLDRELAEIAARHAGQGQALVAKKQVLFLYRAFEDMPDVDHDYDLYSAGITSRFDYYWHRKDWRSRTVAAAVVAVLVSAMLLAVPRLSTSHNLVRYDLWRLTKTNATPIERQRARERIARRLLKPDAAAAHTLCSHSAGYLRNETLPLDAVESILAVLLSRRHDAARDKVNLPKLLADSLRTQNPETRERIQKTLVFLAAEKGKTIAEPLASWKPSKEDSTQTLEERIRQWNSLW